MLMELLDRFLAGDIRALAELITRVEYAPEEQRPILCALYPRTGRAFRLGITGPPGVGKSTLVDRLAYPLAEGGARVGILAVDPSSPFSGGAFLGDRVRMQTVAGHPRVYIRSLASRGSPGGLAPAVCDVSVLLDAFGSEWIMLETVGVGQGELDVVYHADTVLVVLSQEFGDAIQAAKAGLMEIGDIFVVNKADRDGASQAVRELEMALEWKRTHAAWPFPVLQTAATTGQGVSALLEGIQAHRQFLTQNGRLTTRRKQQTHYHLERLLEARIRTNLARQFPPTDWAEHVQRIHDKRETPYDVVERMIARWRT